MSIEEKQETMLMVVRATWMDLILNNLRDNKLPEDKAKERLLRLQVARYLIYDDKLYLSGIHYSTLNVCNKR